MLKNLKIQYGYKAKWFHDILRRLPSYWKYREFPKYMYVISYYKKKFKTTIPKKLQQIDHDLQQIGYDLQQVKSRKML